MNNIVLFDMDGTLTPARKKANRNILRPLIDLSKIADIGIVTGSDIDYVLDQCSNLWDDVYNLDPASIDIMPCNGTKLYRFKNSEWKKICETDMISKIGHESYQKLVRSLIKSQCFVLDDKNMLADFHVSARFLTYRSSLLNWSLIGRDSSFKERESFVQLDKSFSIRINVKRYLESCLDRDVLDKIEIVTGGDTSIDIYPKGWDKTYALKHCQSKTPWFVGDNCNKGGNDYTLYTHLLEEGRSFHTSGPEDTISIIREKIIPALLEQGA